MALEIGEVISLIIAVIGYLVLLIEFKRNRNLLHIFLAYTFLLVGTVTTVAEGFYLPDILNFVEHSVGSALAGLAFGATAYLANKKISEIQKTVRNMIRVKRR